MNQNEELKKDNLNEPSVDGGVDDIAFEEVNDEGEVDARDTIKKLRAKIKSLEQESKNNLDGWMRAKADYANLKKEGEGRRADDIAFANKKLILQILPVLDAYDLAKGNAEAWNKVESNWRVGIEYIFNQLIGVFRDAGVAQFGEVGDIFDPKFHESVETLKADDSSKDNMLAQVLQKGYRMGETVLRPARVKVFHAE